VEYPYRSYIKKSRVSLVFLKQLKRAVAGLNDLMHFYCSVVCPVLEYSSPVWHCSLTVAQTNALEYLQKRALNIMLLDSNYYTACLITLSTWHEHLTKRFFVGVCYLRIHVFIICYQKKIDLSIVINYAIRIHFSHSL